MAFRDNAPPVIIAPEELNKTYPFRALQARTTPSVDKQTVLVVFLAVAVCIVVVGETQNLWDLALPASTVLLVVRILTAATCRVVGIVHTLLPTTHCIHLRLEGFAQVETTVHSKQLGLPCSVQSLRKCVFLERMHQTLECHRVRYARREHGVEQMNATHNRAPRGIIAPMEQLSLLNFRVLLGLIHSR